MEVLSRRTIACPLDSRGAAARVAVHHRWKVEKRALWNPMSGLAKELKSLQVALREVVLQVVRQQVVLQQVVLQQVVLQQVVLQQVVLRQVVLRQVVLRQQVALREVVLQVLRQQVVLRQVVVRQREARPVSRPKPSVQAQSTASCDQRTFYALRQPTRD